MHGSVKYSALFPASEYSQSSRSDDLKPSLSVYYGRKVTDGQQLQVSANAYYSDTGYRYSNAEQESVIDNDVSEDLWNLNANAVYTFTFKDKSSLNLSMQEFYQDTKSRYQTTGVFDQRLYTSESLFFAAYDRNFSKKTMLYTSAGLSYQQYRLQGHDVVRHWSPRLYVYTSYMPDSRQNLRLSVNLGNSTPSISQLNDAEQQIDRVMIRRGNPGLGKSLIVQSKLTYMLNLRKWSLAAYVQYEHVSNGVAGDYFFEDGRLVNTFTDGVRYHECSNMLALTLTPSQSFNMRLNGGYIYDLLRGQLHDQEGTWWADLYANYYLEDFYFSASYSMATRGLTGNGVSGKNPSRYGLAVGWNSDDLSLELRAANPFVPSHRKESTRGFSSAAYSTSSATTGDGYNQCLTLKLTYTFEYGKKVSRSEKVSVGGGDSSILKGKM